MSIQDSLFDRPRLTPRQIAIVALAFFVMIIDGMDIQLLALSAPQILAEWHLTKIAFAPILASAVTGIICGAALGGWAGDRFGRRPLMITSTLVFGVATLAVALAQGATTLMALRFVGGLGFGAALPNSLALALEWSPRRIRPSIGALFSTGSPMGGFLGATLGIWALPTVGWRGLFMAGGVLSIVLAGLLIVLLPESPQHDLRRGRTARATRALRKVLRLSNAEVATIEALPAVGPRPAVRGAAFHTLKTEYGRLFAGSCLLLFVFGTTTQTFTNWLPVILIGAGIPMERAIYGTEIFNVMAITSAVVAPLLLHRFGSRAALIGCILIGQAFLVLLALALRSPSETTGYGLALAAIGVTALAMGSSIAMTYAVMGTVYPAEIRATGIGLAATSLRIGAFAIILGGGGLLSWIPGSAWPLLLTLVALLFLGLIGTMFIDRHISGRTGAH